MYKLVWVERPEAAHELLKLYEQLRLEIPGLEALVCGDLAAAHAAIDAQMNQTPPWLEHGAKITKLGSAE